MDTIYAVSSGAPPAAIAIMRLSGPDALSAAQALAGRLPLRARAGLRALRNPSTRELLDRALVLVFPGPQSATGEDLVEFHLHGGIAVVRAVEVTLASLPGLRAAEPGEFTRRALTYGRIDLAQAEGLGDLLAAQTEAQRRAAIGVAEGLVSRAILDWNSRLLGISAVVEAQLDFSDEDDVDADQPMDAVRVGIAALAEEMATLLAAPTVTRLHDGIRVVLAGPPNAGKSTLFNAMVQRDAAIVSPIAGTTRDRIEAPIVRAGLALLVIDTAGLAEDSDDPIERIGIDRAHDAIAEADVVLWLGDTPPADDALWLYPRADMRPPSPAGRVAVSAATGEGLADLWEAIAARAAKLVPREGAVALNDRQHALCRQCCVALDRARQATDLLIVAEELRLARAALDRVTGRSDVEAMLDTLFGRFCIGK